MLNFSIGTHMLCILADSICKIAPEARRGSFSNPFFADLKLLAVS